MRRLAQLLRRPRDAELGLELALFIGPQLRCSDLLDLVAEELRPPLALTRVAAERLAFATKRGQHRVRVRDALAQCRVAAVCVEDLALPRGPRETKLVALTVDRDEIGAR